jgi:hypothetical protein
MCAHVPPAPVPATRTFRIRGLPRSRKSTRSRRRAGVSRTCSAYSTETWPSIPGSRIAPPTMIAEKSDFGVAVGAGSICITSAPTRCWPWRKVFSVHWCPPGRGGRQAKFSA